MPVTVPDRFAATHYGPLCPQIPLGESAPVGSEDCLTINVWAPPARGATPLPVMVFIPGGAFLFRHQHPTALRRRVSQPPSPRSFNILPEVPACAHEVCHTAELPYIFNTAAAIGFGFTSAEETLARQVAGYWSAFARPGHDPSPAGSGRPTWPAFPGEHYLLLDTPPMSAVDPPHNCAFWDTVGYNELKVHEVLEAGTP